MRSMVLFARADLCPLVFKWFAGRFDPMQPRLLLPSAVSLGILIALSAGPRSLAAEQAMDVPGWLKVHVGEGPGQIPQVVLQRARTLYLQKVSDGAVKNPCYFAMDAT